MLSNAKELVQGEEAAQKGMSAKKKGVMEERDWGLGENRESSLRWVGIYSARRRGAVAKGNIECCVVRWPTNKRLGLAVPGLGWRAELTSSPTWGNQRDSAQTGWTRSEPGDFECSKVFWTACPLRPITLVGARSNPWLSLCLLSGFREALSG